jgi:hypothetical protein
MFIRLIVITTILLSCWGWIDSSVDGDDKISINWYKYTMGIMHIIPFVYVCL